MRLIDYLRFFMMSILTLFFVMLTACAVIGGEWMLTYVFGVLVVAAAYLWTQIPLSGGNNKKGKGGSYA